MAETSACAGLREGRAFMQEAVRNPSRREPAKHLVPTENE
jgi:hypothetical protein